MSTEATILSIEGLGVRFPGVTAVRNFDLTCKAGSLTVLTGANGTGKTTVVNAISGVCPVSSGAIRIRDRLIGRRWSPARAFAIGVRRSFQVPRLWPSLTLIENISLASDLAPSRLVEELGRTLPGVSLDRSPVGLSLGQRRILELLRLELARGRCVLALLDEPLSGLDEENSQLVADRVQKLRLSGAAVLLVDHEPHRWPERSQTVELSAPVLGEECA